ncbi:MAG: methyltransferase family protein [Terriglobia bacterium]
MDYDSLISIPWAAFVILWVVSALAVKKNAYQRASWWRWGWLRVLLILVCFVVLPQTRYFRHALLFASPAVRMAGFIICVAGVAFAIWARLTLGANWSAVPSIKHGHELVVAGPYCFVRHPIYGGILIALLGSALAAGAVWLILVVLAAAMFALRIPREERLMMQQFPNEYPGYARRTKALIPYAL